MSILDDISALLPPVDGGDDAEDAWQGLKTRIMILSGRAWEGRVNWDLVERWLKNFDGLTGRPVEEERLHALYILSQFLYFGNPEIRVLLRAIYRDLFLLPLIQEVRQDLGGIRDEARIRSEVFRALDKTRFLGIGNPSESGVHLLYFFRQENGLSKEHFLDTAQILSVTPPVNGIWRSLRFPDVERYVFVDDVCGSGDTAANYSKDILDEVKNLKPDVKISYLCMFGTVDGLKVVRDSSAFGNSTSAVYELDETYKCLSTVSRYLKVFPRGIDPDAVREIALKYGEKLLPAHPTGFSGSELLLGFHHNTPDNTLPLIWMDRSHNSAVSWTPVFRRYPKI
jgi:hypothetical protein